MFLPGDTQGSSFSVFLGRTIEASDSQPVFNSFSQTIQLPDFYSIQKNSLRAVSPSGASSQVLASLSGGESEAVRSGIVEYVVKEGDTLWSVAQSFDISLSTLLWANNLSSNSAISVGKKLVILPVSGVMHLVKAGDTLGEIAKYYKADLPGIIAANELNNENDIFVGDMVVVPGGVMPSPAAKPATVLAPLAAGYFICPVSAPCRVTQGLHWYNAIDFSHGQCGEPIYAAAGGTVQKVKLTDSRSKWAYGGAGNHVTILHPNGVVSFYGHLASAQVSPGDQVSQGQIIGYMGGSPGMPGAGNSTGCHVHFQVIGAKNPFVP